MTRHIEVLENSFQQIVPYQDAFAEALYERLFTQCPHVHDLFAHTDMRQQRKKLMASLGLVMSTLRQPEQLPAILKQLGQRHEAYGVQPEHYALLATVLLETLADFLGNQWTTELRAAWLAAYETIVALMLAGYSTPLEGKSKVEVEIEIKVRE